MVDLARLPDVERIHLEKIPCPELEPTPLVSGPALSERRVALVTTAGLARRDDAPFGAEGEYRILPTGTPAGDLVMSHSSVNFDRTGFQQDINVVYPLDRLHELAEEGVIGSVADYHYSFMGATPTDKIAQAAEGIIAALKGDHVDAVCLAPV
ncbi:MAG: glycine/sarcosine/betaine reductase selenoprotein B family protein [Rhodospirillales bacterium]